MAPKCHIAKYFEKLITYLKLINLYKTHQHGFKVRRFGLLKFDQQNHKLEDLCSTKAIDKKCDHKV